MKTFITVYWFMLLIGLLPLSARAQVVSQGIVVLNSSKGNDPKNVVFKAISFPTPYSGVAIGEDGSANVFDQAEITKVLYFDQDYYSRMNSDSQKSANRDGLEVREMVIQGRFSTVQDDAQLEQVKRSLTSISQFEERYPTTTSLLSNTVGNLQDIIAKYQAGNREQMGVWMTKAQFDSRIDARPKPAKPKSLSFTSKDGQKFENAKVSMGDTGVFVMTNDGGTTLTLNQLPDDLTEFPDDVVKAANEARATIKAEKDQAKKLADQKAKADAERRATEVPVERETLTDKEGQTKISMSPPIEIFEGLGSPIPDDVASLKFFYGNNPTYLDRISEDACFVAGIKTLDNGKWCISVLMTKDFPDWPTYVRDKWRSDFSNLTEKIIGHKISLEDIYKASTADNPKAVEHNIDLYGWTFRISSISGNPIILYSPSEFIEPSEPTADAKPTMQPTVADAPTNNITDKSIAVTRESKPIKIEYDVIRSKDLAYDFVARFGAADDNTLSFELSLEPNEATEEARRNNLLPYNWSGESWSFSIVKSELPNAYGIVNRMNKAVDEEGANLSGQFQTNMGAVSVVKDGSGSLMLVYGNQRKLYEPWPELNTLLEQLLREGVSGSFREKPVISPSPNLAASQASMDLTAVPTSLRKPILVGVVAFISLSLLVFFLTRNSSRRINFYISRNGEDSGPFTLKQLKSLAQQGQVSKHDLIYREGWKSWMTADNVPGLVQPVSSNPSPQTPEPRLPPPGNNPRP